MDLPILKYVDVVIGLSVVLLLVCTIVTAITQFLLSFSFSRARNLRDGVEDLVRQLDPATLAPYARYIAERCLRHPLVASNNTPFGNVTTHVRNWFRNRRRGLLPLPALNPPDIIQREELILMLLEWAAEEGALKQQDDEIAARWQVNLAGVRKALGRALLKTGIGDPATTARNIRDQIVRIENANPDQASAISRAAAICAATQGDMVGKIHVWFDNTMARISATYGLEAQVVSAVLAFLLVFTFQLDALDLIKRLAQDDKLRADLVQEAKDQTARIDQAGQQLAATKDEKQQDSQKKVIDEATVIREQISTTLATLRDPNRTVVPAFLLWQSVAQSLACIDPAQAGWSGGRVSGTVLAGADRRPLAFDWNPDRAIEEFATAVRASGAPVAVYVVGFQDKRCLRLVALDANTGSIDAVLARPPNPQANEQQNVSLLVRPAKWAGFDWPGFHSRFTGMLLGSILVSLGAPFWYDLVKKLIGLRSLLAKKDDDDRQLRQGQEGAVRPPVTEVPPPAAAAAVAAAGEDERGNLDATGAQG